MIIRVNRTHSMVMVCLMVLATGGVAAVGLTNDVPGVWYVFVWFVIGSLLCLYQAIKRPAQVIIDSEYIEAGGKRFPMANIRSASIANVAGGGSGGEGKYLQIGFLSDPGLPWSWRIMGRGFGFPKKTSDGTPLEPQPRLLLPLYPKDVSDDVLDSALSAALDRG